MIGALAVLTGGIGIAALPGALEGYVAELLGAPAAHRERVALGFAVLAAGAVGIPVLLLGVYFLRLGRRVQAAGRHPPPGMRVVVDTPILTGAGALRHARRLRHSGWVCVLAAPALAGWSYWRLRTLATLLGSD